MLDGMAGERALSREGHAAMSMSGAEDKWREMQQNTFTNWVNEHLKNANLSVNDLTEDLGDGTVLIALVESLQGKTIAKNKRKPNNQHQRLENVSKALQALMDDKIKLVNIGSEDIVEGNDKLIMGLIWLMILRYQIGKTKVPPKKLMLGWINATLPTCNINNFTRDWNDGVALHALVNYCDPRLSPDWKNLDRSQRLANCTSAMELARKELNIPMVLAPEYMASPHLDELSCMTYVSYFIKPQAPGYKASLQWVRKTLPDRNIENFTSDWRDGVNLCHLVHTMGGDVPNHPNYDPKDKTRNIQTALDAGSKLGIQPVLTAKEIAEVETEHLGLLSYVSKFRYISPKTGKKDSILLVGNPETIKCGQSKVFKLESKTADISKPNVKIKVDTPAGTRPCKIQWSGKYGDINFTSTDAGNHELHVMYYDEEVSGSPVKFKVVSDISKINLPQLKPCIVGGVQEIKIPTDGAGVGSDLKVEARTPSGRIIDLPIRQENGQYVVRFTPAETGRRGGGGGKTESPDSLVELHEHNPQLINGVLSSEHDLVVRNEVGENNLVPMAEVSELGPVSFVDGREATLDGSRSEVERSEKFIVADGTSSITFAEDTDVDLGEWELSMLCEGKHISGSPAVMAVYDPQKVKVVRPEHAAAVLGSPATFNVDCSGAGSGNLTAHGTFNGKPFPVSVTPNQRDSYHLSFLPVAKGKHTVHVHYNETEIKGSPYSFAVSDPESDVSVYGAGLSAASASKNAEFTLRSNGVPKDEIRVVVKDPHGRLVPSQIKRVGDEYKIQYQPNSVGRYSVELFVSGHLLNSTPYYVDVHDAQKVQVKSQKPGLVGQETAIDVDVHSAGTAELELEVKSPSGETLKHSKKLHGQDLYHVTYKPREAGPHTVSVLYGGVPIKGSPITQTVSGGEDKVRAYGDGLVRAEEKMEASFHVNTHAAPGELDVKIEGPQSISKHRIVRESAGVYGVHYTPVENGIYHINVYWNGKHVPESPYSAQVVSPDKVTPVDGWNNLLDNDGTLPLRVGQEKTMKFDTEHAGPGALTSRVVGPRGEEVPSHVINNQVVRFTPQAQGDHTIHLRWADYELPQGPVRARAMPATAPLNAAKVRVRGPGTKDAVVKEESEFVIDGSEAGPGKLKVQMSGVKSNMDVRVKPSGSGNYTCTYSPLMPGAYLLHILWSDQPVPGSPFKVNVSLNSDSNKVLCSGEGLRNGVMGKDIKSLIDTRRAGPGELSAQCMGPHKPAYCELYDHKDGTYNLNVKPQEPGRHILHVKFAEEHVPGSPFVVKVSAAPDASKVRVTGPGTEPGVLDNYQSRFICETRGAGAGQLTVRIRGPKGAFRVEMQRESQKDRTILCRYDPTEAGEYIIHVKWSGDHVPGSPFNVRIFNKDPELEKYLSENPNYNSETKSWNADI